MTKSTGEKKIEISVAKNKKVVYDFGLFNSPKHIKVDKSFWIEYVKVRGHFEVLNDYLVNKLKDL